jgi:carbonic anhydrase
MRPLLLALLPAALLFATDHTGGGATPEQALARLKEGNERYVAGHMAHPNSTSLRRAEVVNAQHPFAVVLGCSDSRVPPEIIFDQGLGDLFVIRDAGNVLDNEVFGTIEYAIEHLGSRLIVVLGHEGCGAVTVAVQGGAVPGHVKTVVDSIAPAVKESKGLPGDKVHNCVLANARRSARRLRGTGPILKHLSETGRLKVVAADYDLATGKVEFLTDELSKDHR